MEDYKALQLILEARELLYNESINGGGTRELAIAITKLDEAEMWRHRDLQLKNHCEQSEE